MPTYKRTRSRVTNVNGIYTVKRTGPITSTTDSVVSVDKVTQTFKDQGPQTYAPGKVFAMTGKIPINDCDSYKVYERKDGQGLVQKTNGSDTWTYSGCNVTSQFAGTYGCSFLPYQTLVGPEKSEQFCLQQALAKVDASPRSFAEDLATWRQTAGFLKNPTATLVKLSNVYAKAAGKALKMRTEAKKAKYLADLWLEYRFAFLPTVQTAHNLLISFEEEMGHREKQVRPSFGVARHSETVEKETGDVVWSSTPVGRFRRQSKVVIQTNASIYYSLTNPVETRGWRYGLSAKHVPRLLWDLSPYSFVVDRVLDVGKTIEGFTNLLDPNINLSGACTSVLTTQHSSIELVGCKESGWTYTAQRGGVSSQTIEKYTRTRADVNLGSIIPTARLGNLLSSTSRTTDALALAYQLVFRNLQRGR